MAAAIAHRLALAPVSSLATVEVLAGRPLKFIVTNKSGFGQGTFPELSALHLSIFIIALALLPLAVTAGPLIFAAILALMSCFPAACITSSSLRRYRAGLIPNLTGAPT